MIDRPMRGQRVQGVAWGILLLAVMAGAWAAEPATQPTSRSNDRPWMPKPAPADAALVPARCRIINFGDDMGRGDTGASYGTAYRMGKGNPPYQFAQDRDVDGDGKTDDDFVGYVPFSLSEPLNPPTSPKGGYLPEAMNGRFYGGLTYYFADTQRRNRPFEFEAYINADHDGPFFDPRAEDFAFSGQAEGANPNSRYQQYGLFLWKKDNFRNGGDRNRVSFDDASRIVVFIARYYYGWTDGRFVVQDKDQFYISEQTFQAPDWFRGVNWVMGFPFILHPTRTRWAAYSPHAPYHIGFDPAAAQFQEHQFQDIQSVGWYIAKHKLAKDESHLKWYCVDVDAVVHRPARPSESIAMSKVPGAGGANPDFYMAACEVPYSLWKKVYRFATAPTYGMEPGYLFQKRGDMGSMDYGSVAHEPDEPVTGITWLDAVAFCNALSEMEGKTPCYYTDPELKAIFRFQEIATYANQPDPMKPPVFEKRDLPKIHLKWDADGYRLPTIAEWQQAGQAAKQQRDVNHAWIAANSQGKTHPVASAQPNSLGIHDLLGNVWEYCWDAGDVCDAQAADRHVVLGGDMHYPSDPATRSASPFGDQPWTGSYNIGIRLVRRDAGAPAPSPAPAPKPAVGTVAGAPGFDPAGPAWLIQRDQKTPAVETKPATQPLLDLAKLPEGTFVRGADQAKVFVSSLYMGRHDVTFEKWKMVCHWALTHGYSFASGGDMGSMYWYDFPHSPDEPVTNITFHDCLVWCNALSEMEGKAPVYCEDEAMTQVYRSAFTYRPIKIRADELGASLPTHGPYAKYGRGEYVEPWLFARWDADGYRLPTVAEWEYAARAGCATTYFWGKDATDKDQYVWDNSNAGNTTHPVGQKKPNAFGLYDITGNVYQRLWSVTPGGQDYYDDRNPKKGRYGNYFKTPRHPAKGAPICVGASWFWGDVGFRDKYGFWCFAGGTAAVGFPDVGFRVVRCDAGTHPRDGIEEHQDRIVVQVDAKQDDALEGAAFRGNLRRDGVYPVGGLSALKGVKWKFKTGGPVKSSPVVVDGLLYVGSEDGNFYAIRADTGQEAWKLPIRKGSESSAAIKDGVVCFGGNDGYLYAVGAKTGEVKWKFADSRSWARGPITGSPAIAHGTVFVTIAGDLRGIDLASGQEVFHYRDGESPPRRSSIAILSDRMYICAGGWNSFDAVDIATERMKWRGNASSTGQCNTPAIADGLVYATCSAGIDVFDLKTGAKKWSNAVDKGATMNEWKLNSSPAVWGGLVFFGMDNGRVYALDAKSGKEAWAFEVGQPVRSSPAVAARDGMVFFGAHDGQVYALDARSGALKWKYQTGAAVSSSPWLGDGLLYIGSEDGNVYALGPDDR